jgi:hypothetical protein
LDELHSTRTTPRIEMLIAVVIDTPEGESVVRRDTPVGTTPWITDDETLAPVLLALAREESGFPSAYLARFRRVA